MKPKINTLLLMSLLTAIGVAASSQSVNASDNKPPVKARGGSETHGACPGLYCPLEALRYSAAPQPIKIYKDGDLEYRIQADRLADLIPDDASLRFTVEMIQGRAQFGVQNTRGDGYGYRPGPGTSFPPPSPISFGPSAENNYALAPIASSGVWSLVLRSAEVPSGILYGAWFNLFAEKDELPLSLRYRAEIVGRDGRVLRTPYDYTLTVQSRSKHGWVSVAPPMLKMFKQADVDQAAQ